MSVEIIVECLRRYRKRESERALPTGPLPIRIMYFDEIVRERSPQERVDALLNDQFRSTLRLKVRELGMVAFMHGGLDEMERLAGEVEDSMSEAPSFAGSTLDKWWDGIGCGVNGHAGWAA